MWLGKPGLLTVGMHEAKAMLCFLLKHVSFLFYVSFLQVLVSFLLLY